MTTLTYGMRNVGNNGDQKGNELFISNYPLETKTQKISTLFYEYEIMNMKRILPRTMYISHWATGR